MFAKSLIAAMACASAALGQSLMTGPGGTINSPTFNETLKTCETLLVPINITGIPNNTALITLQLVGDGKIPPSYNFDGDVFIPLNGTLIDTVPWPSQFGTGSVNYTGHYFLEVNEWAVNCSTGQPFRYTLQGQINAIYNGFDESDCPS